ncbi:unnamed protein product [Schistosoma rodhaini]|nr:unnamed protein product [Schistosoma rodhaini]
MVTERTQPTVNMLIFSKEYLRPKKNVHEPTDAYFDHTKVTIGSRSNEALQSIFDLLLKEYIEFWYRPFTSNPDFMVQLKMFLQYSCAVIVQRVKNIDLSEFIINRFIPHFFDHIVHILSLTSDRLNTTGVSDIHDETQTMLKENHFLKSPLKSCSEEAILCAFGDRLHAALYSRQAEVMYLRAVVNRLLPVLGMPPSLSSSEMHKSKEPSVDHGHRLRRNRPIHNSPGHAYGSSERGRKSPVVSRSASTGALFFQKFMELGCNPSLSSFLIEILSTCVLLPAMDILANSDFVNHLILLSFPECTPIESLIKHDCEHVPLLEAYIDDWEKWLSNKQSTVIDIEKLLSQQDEFYPFMQYMKSVKSIEPLTVLLLMYQINSRVSKSILSSDACHEISAQLQHILNILNGQMLNDNNDNDTMDNIDMDHHHDHHHRRHHHQSIYQISKMFTQNQSTEPITNSRHLQIFNISNEFKELLKVSLKYCSPETINQLVNTSQWKETYQSVCKTVELRFIPMYLESPEYIKHSFGFSHISTSSASSLNKIGVRSPKRDIRRLSQNVGTNQQQTGLFGNALMNVFNSQSTDGQFFGNLDSSKLSVSSIRRNQKDRFTNILNEQTNRSNRYYTNTGTTTTTTAINEELITNQHVIGIKHLPETTPQLDLSQCNVYIRGLSRPEVVSQSNTRHPLGIITTSTNNPPMLSSSTTLGMTNLHSNQTHHLPASMNMNILSNTINTTTTTTTTTTMTTPISSSTTAVRDISYRNKISNELNNLINPSVYNNSVVSSSSSSLPQLSTQFMFNVITEMIVNGVRRQVAKVTRKYSEFYVLEQKLIEFHGSLIIKQLPKRQLIPRTMEFLESKCDAFQSYLQYLIAQPFLRNSKLLYSFLMSNEPFNTNIFELNLGRLVKSVPLKLTKEKGQFLDNFLSTYFLSCHPQPMECDNTTTSINDFEMIRSKSLSIYSTTETDAYSASYNSLLNTTNNNHISSTKNIIGDTTFHSSSTNILQDRNLIHKSISNNFKMDTYPIDKHIDYYSRYVLNSPQHKHQSRTSLDHRLRSRIYWNNAGLTYEKQKDTINQTYEIGEVVYTPNSPIVFIR